MTSPTSDTVTGEVRTTCSGCNNSGVGDPDSWHPYRHSYKGPWRPASSPESDPHPMPGTPMTPGMAFDPVLRLALVNKGLITVEDLQQAQAQMLIITGNIPQAIREAVGDDVPGRSTVGG